MKMADYIDRDLFAREVNRLSTNPFNEWDTMGVLLLLDTIPSADVKPVVRGKWTDNNACPFCGYQPWFERDIHTLSFCPNCGADLRGKSDG